MKRGTKLTMGFVIVILALTAILTFSVTVRLSDDLKSQFRHNSDLQLQNIRNFIDGFFALPIAHVTELAANRVIIDNLDALTVYKERTDSFVIRPDYLHPRERLIYEELVKVFRQSPTYDLVYIGNTEGGFTEISDNYADVEGLLKGFDPTVRPWFAKARAEKRVVIVDAYLSNNGQSVCTLAAPVLSLSGNDFKGVVGIDIRLDTLTDETAKATLGQTGYVILIDSEGKVVCDPRNSGPKTSPEARWIGKTVHTLPAEAAQALGQALAHPDDRLEVDLNGRRWLVATAEAQSGWSIIFLQEKREVFLDAASTAARLVVLGLIIIVSILVILMAILPHKLPLDKV